MGNFGGVWCGQVIVYISINKYDYLMLFIIGIVIMDILDVMCVFVVVVECNGFSVVVQVLDMFMVGVIWQIVVLEQCLFMCLFNCIICWVSLISIGVVYYV